MRLTAPLIALCLCSTLVLIVSVMGHQAQRDEELAIKRATRSIGHMLAEAERVVSMNRAFLGQPCTSQLVRQLGRSAALSPHVRDVRLLQNNVSVCSSLFGVPELPPHSGDAREQPLLFLMPGDELTPASSLLVMVRQFPEGGVAVSLNGLFLRQTLRATVDLPGLIFRAGGLEMQADGLVRRAQDISDTPPPGRYAFSLAADPKSPVYGSSLLLESLPWILLILSGIFAAAWTVLGWQHRRGKDDAMLRRAIRAGEIRPSYQPVVDSRTGELAGCEVLARWHTRRGEVIQPDQFIPLAERNDQIIPLTRSLLRQVARELGPLRHELPPEFHLSFNLSAAHAGDEHLLDTCRELQLALPGVILVVEITERERFEPSSRLPELLPALRAVGVRVALDDFGTGYAGLSTLDQLPVDYIKLDRTFTTQISDVASTRERMLMAEMVTEMADRMKLEVVAEGVETVGQRDWLKAHGVNWLQGYLYSKPLPLTDFTAYLRRNLPKGGEPDEDCLGAEPTSTKPTRHVRK